MTTLTCAMCGATARDFPAGGHIEHSCSAGTFVHVPDAAKIESPGEEFARIVDGLLDAAARDHYASRRELLTELQSWGDRVADRG